MFLGKWQLEQVALRKVHILAQADEVLCQIDGVRTQVDADNLGPHALGDIDESAIAAANFECWPSAQLSFRK